MLEPARSAGAPKPVARLVAKLVAKAGGRNIPGGRFYVGAYTAAGCANFSIANTGPLIPPRELTRLLQALQRITCHPGPPTGGVAPAPAIAQATANTHDVTGTAHPEPRAVPKPAWLPATLD